MTSLTDAPLTMLDGRETTFAEFADHVVLVVNVASRCGLAPQYEQLEELQKRYADRGFTVLGVPSNQFLQELSSEEKIAAAKAAWAEGDWAHGRFTLPPGDDAEFIPLPG